MHAAIFTARQPNVAMHAGVARRCADWSNKRAKNLYTNAMLYGIIK